jgi:hypothetical protein
MAFFRNRIVNLLNIHYGIFALVMSGGGAFYAVFLLKAGVPVRGVFLALAAINLGRFAIRPMVPALAARFGLKPLLIAGTLVGASQYFFLARVDGVGPWLFALIVVSSIGDTLYWTTYHAYFASLGDDEHRGHQVSAREALAQVAGIIGPLVTGWALTVYGPKLAFGITSVLMLAAALPFLGTPNVKVAKSAPGAWRAARPGVLLFMADGWISAGFFWAWQITLFITLGRSFSAYGGAMALAAVVGAASGMVLGRLIDAGHGRRAVYLAMAVFTLTIAFRLASQGHPALAVAANACGAFVACLYMPTMMTPVYNLAKAAPCTLRFHVATEGGWDVGASSACLLASGLMSLGAPLSVAMALSFLGIGASTILLLHYYAGQPDAAAVALGGTTP